MVASAYPLRLQSSGWILSCEVWDLSLKKPILGAVITRSASEFFHITDALSTLATGEYYVSEHI